MKNPWLQLPQSAPYILPTDLTAVRAFNATASTKGLIHEELLPEPFIGRVDAPVMLLSLNPGFDVHDIDEHVKPEFVERCRANLCHASAEYPFYLLDPALAGTGQRYWRRILRRPIEDRGLVEVARSVMVVELFPYHSQNCHHRGDSFPSQAYGFSLVRAAIAREALVVFLRSKTLWMSVIPELGAYQNQHALTNPRNPTVSPGNCPSGYDDILSRIA